MTATRAVLQIRRHVLRRLPIILKRRLPPPCMTTRAIHSSDQSNTKQRYNFEENGGRQDEKEKEDRHWLLNPGTYIFFGISGFGLNNMIKYPSKCKAF
mmetsp:Transcript_12599/g.22829  ORF Transcript_12599/g.22829 Transcript_12599/m.22829 type:complete len:98 (+) Transcript_12599:187-480(+)